MSDRSQLERAANLAADIRGEISKRVIGQGQTVDALLMALFAGSHATLVGVPGLAKTLLVSTLAECLGLSFGRVQFTPDLLPSDITGSEMLSDKSEGGRRLEFVPGPIFKNLVLADEVNRTPPKTQAALLQAMQERSVTIGNQTHRLPSPFFVLATRNPVEQEGTYHLPEAQLDRFLFEIPVDYPTEAEELQIARLGRSNSNQELKQVVSREELEALIAWVPQLPITDEAVQLAVSLSRATRPKSDSCAPAAKEFLSYGAGPRGSQSLVLAAKTKALLSAEPVADIKHVLSVAPITLSHRLVLNFRAEAENRNATEILHEILSNYR